MRSLKNLFAAALTIAALSPTSALAQFSFTPVDPYGAPQNDPTLTGRPTTVWQGSRQFTPSIDFLRFNTNSRDRWYPSYSYNGGQTFTRDPGAFSGRRDRAHNVRVMTAQEFRRHQELANWQPGVGVILIRGEVTGATGLNVGVFRDGRWVMVQGDAGHISLDVLRAEGGLSGDLQVNATDGLILSGNAGARLTLVGVTGQTSRGQLGNRDFGADIQATGRAAVLAEATATGNLALGPQGLRARLGGEAFAGARATGEIPVGVSLLGVRFAATGRGHVSAGAGVNGNAYLGANTTGVRGGCELGGCLGVGAGAGVDVEIDASQFIDSSLNQNYLLPARRSIEAAPENFRQSPANQEMLRIRRRLTGNSLNWLLGANATPSTQDAGWNGSLYAPTTSVAYDPAGGPASADAASGAGIQRL